MSPGDAALRAEIAAMRAEQAELREDVQLLTRRLLKADDRAVLAELLPLAAAVMGDTTWTSEDLAARAVSLKTPQADALAELIAAQDTEAGGLRAFGKTLGRIEGISVGGLRLVRSGTEGGVALWAVLGFRAAQTQEAHGAQQRR